MKTVLLGNTGRLKWRYGWFSELCYQLLQSFKPSLFQCPQGTECLIKWSRNWVHGNTTGLQSLERRLYVWGRTKYFWIYHYKKKKHTTKLAEHCYCFPVLHQLKDATFTKNSAQRNKNVAYYAVILKFMCKAMLLYGVLFICVTNAKHKHIFPLKINLIALYDGRFLYAKSEMHSYCVLIQ